VELGAFAEGSGDAGMRSGAVKKGGALKPVKMIAGKDRRFKGTNFWRKGVCS